MIVAFAPGGFTDIAARLLAERLSTSLGQAVTVDNRAGAAGIIGTEAAARSAPDGYTVLMGTISTHAINVGLYRTLPYDPVADFAPVSGVATSPNLLVTHPSKGIADVAALVTRARAQPGVLTMAPAATAPPAILRASCSSRSPASISCTCHSVARPRRQPRWWPGRSI
jgi:tripartite-type tricarboxylate transporter receptor subunit TctC